MTVLGTTRKSPLPLADKTKFQDFESPTGIVGLAKLQDGVLIVLAVAAKNEGTGQLREFVKQAKQEYKHIIFVDVWGQKLLAALARYGFLPCTYLDADTDELADGMTWEAAT